MENRDSLYQRILQLWMPACNDTNGCDVCPAGGLDDNLCRNMYDVICNQSPKWWEKQFGHLETIERSPQKGRTPPKPVYITEEILLTCSNCKIQEPITLVNGELESTIKFNQIKGTGDVLHICSKDIHCQAKLLNGKTVCEYIKGK